MQSVVRWWEARARDVGDVHPNLGRGRRAKHPNLGRRASQASPQGIARRACARLRTRLAERRRVGLERRARERERCIAQRELAQHARPARVDLWWESSADCVDLLRVEEVRAEHVEEEGGRAQACHDHALHRALLAREPAAARDERHLIRETNAEAEEDRIAEDELGEGGRG